MAEPNERNKIVYVEFEVRRAKSVEIKLTIGLNLIARGAVDLLVACSTGVENFLF